MGLRSVAPVGGAAPALLAVSCPAAANCMATTVLDVTEHWNGTAWAIEYLAKPSSATSFEMPTVIVRHGHRLHRIRRLHREPHPQRGGRDLERQYLGGPGHRARRVWPQPLPQRGEQLQSGQHLVPGDQKLHGGEPWGFRILERHHLGQ